MRDIRSSMPAIRRLTSVGRGSSVWRREKANSRCVRAAARCAELGRCLDETVDVVEAAVLNPPLNPLQPPTDALQQIVEVVGDAARQLPDGFHLLCLAQLILGGGERELLLTLLRDVSCRTVQGALNRRRRPGESSVGPVPCAQAVGEGERVDARG